MSNKQSQKHVSVNWRPSKTETRNGEKLGDPVDAKSIATSFKTNYGGDYPFQAYNNPERARKEVIPGEDTVLIAELEAGQKVPVNSGRWQDMAESMNSEFLANHFDEVDESTVEVLQPVGVGTGAVKHTENEGVMELGGATVWPAFWGTKTEYGEGLYESSLSARRDLATEEMDADIDFTQTVTSRHAKTGHMFEKLDYVTEGISDKKYPQVWSGEGRETVVRQTDAARNNYRFTESSDNSRDLYYPDELSSLVDHVLSGINEVRANHGKGKLDRNQRGSPEYEGLSEVEDYFKVEVEEDTEVGYLSSVKVKPSAEGLEESYTPEEVVEKIEESRAKEGVEWIDVTFDANHESSAAIADHLVGDLGYEPEKFSPEAFRYESDEELQVSDALGVQYRPDRTNDIQLIDEAKNLAEKMGLNPVELDKSSESKHSNYVGL